MSNLEIVTDADGRREVRRAAAASTPTSRRCAATRPTVCRGSPASARRPPRPCWPRTATSRASSPPPKRARACRPASAQDPHRTPLSRRRTDRRRSRAATSTSPRPTRGCGRSTTPAERMPQPSPSVGAGHRDDADHRRARRRRDPLIRDRPARTPPGVRASPSAGQTNSQAPRRTIERMPATALGRVRAPVPAAAGGHALRPGRHRVPHPGARRRSASRSGSTSRRAYALHQRRAGRGIRSRPARPRGAGPAPRSPSSPRSTLADLFVPPDASPPFIALAFAIIGAVVRGARLWALISVGAGVAHRDRRDRIARHRRGTRSASRSRRSASRSCFAHRRGHARAPRARRRSDARSWPSAAAPPSRTSAPASPASCTTCSRTR